MTTHTDPQEATSGPYATAAPIYWAAGWRGCLPLPAGQKKPVPTGYTGSAGAWPSYPDVHAWTEDRGHGNIAVRLPPDVLGVDVDSYDAKPGALVLADLEQRLGPLPATWRTTSRDDGASGIRLYRVPPGLRWPGILGPGIETIRHEHRYAVVWPSRHPNGGTYRWITPDGATSLESVPSIDDLPALPDAWISHFTSEMATEQQRAGTTGAADWWHLTNDGAPCRHMQHALTRGLADLAGAASRHDCALQLTNRLVWLAGEGHAGVTDALEQARAVFLAAVGSDRSDGEAVAEWERMTSGAARMAAAAHPKPGTDPCLDPFAGLIPKEQPWTSPTPSPTSATSVDASTQPGTTTSATATTGATAGTTQTPALTTSETTTSDAPRTTWWPKDLDAILSGEITEEGPDRLTRDDGHALLYAGKINGIIGPSESGKTWVALVAVAQAVRDGHNVTFIDFEDTDYSVVARLLSLGLTADQIRDHVAYIAPDIALHAVASDDLRYHLEQHRPVLVVLDGFNAAMTLHAYDLLSNKDATAFFQLVLRNLTVTGATVLYVDHTPKDKANESSGGIGAQAKRAMTDGAILRANVVKEFGRGQKGTVRLFVDKDRPGFVRGVSSPHKIGERNVQWAADLTLEPAGDDRLDASLSCPQTIAEGCTPFRPTVLMARISEYVSGNPGAGRNDVLRDVTGDNKALPTALKALVDEGWLRVEQRGQKRSHFVVKPYSELAELASDQPGVYRGCTEGATPGWSEASSASSE